MIDSDIIDHASLAMRQLDPPPDCFPLAKALVLGLSRYGESWIGSNEAKRLIWPLAFRAFDEPETLNMESEYGKLVDSCGIRCTRCGRVCAKAGLCDLCKQEEEEDNVFASRRADFDTNPDREF